jgi:hypothetical protein
LVSGLGTSSDGVSVCQRLEGANLGITPASRANLSLSTSASSPEAQRIKVSWGRRVCGRHDGGGSGGGDGEEGGSEKTWLNTSMVLCMCQSLLITDFVQACISVRRQVGRKKRKGGRDMVQGSGFRGFGDVYIQSCADNLTCRDFMSEAEAGYLRSLLETP